jgi:hypothetical protein
MATSLTQSTARPGFNSRYQSAPRGGATIAGSFATPGYKSPFAVGGGILDAANNSGTAENMALSRFRNTGSVGSIQGGIKSSFGMGGGGRGRGQGYRQGGSGGGGGGGRIDARAQLSPATGRGLADFYAMNAKTPQGQFAMPSEFDRLQQRAEQQQGWMNPVRPFDPFNGFGTPGPAPTSWGNQAPINPSVFSGGPAFPTLPNLPTREKGGPVGKIQPYIVNEKGEEAYQPKGGFPQLITGPEQFFFPPVDGKIIPHKKTKEMMKDGKVLPPQHRQMGGMVKQSMGSPFSTMNQAGSSFSFGSPGANAPMGQPMKPLMSSPMQMGMGGSFGSRGFSNIQFRANGGPVQASFGMQESVQYDPWAAKHFARKAQGGSMAQPASYDQLYQQGQQLGINMQNAPRTLSGLQRYLDMGRGSQGAVRDARAAARASLAQSAKANAPMVGPLTPIDVYGSGSSTFGPRPAEQVGMFANQFGQMLPWEAPPWQQGQGIEDMQMSWLQDRALTQAQERSSRSRPASSRRSAPRRELTEEDFIFDFNNS